MADALWACTVVQASKEDQKRGKEQILKLARRKSGVKLKALN